MIWKMEFENSPTIEDAANVDFDKLLASVDGVQNQFSILSKSDQFYIQTYNDGSGFELEKREGSKDFHFIAMRKGFRDPVRKKLSWWHFWKSEDQSEKFHLATIVQEFRAFQKQDSTMSKVNWAKADMI